MGAFMVPVRLASLDGEHTRDTEAMVDTGAAYSVAPASLLAELGVSPARTSTFELGDGRTVDMGIGRALATINGVSEVTLVVFAPEGSTPLLGAYTLEGLQLTVDPVNQRLTPTERLPL